MDDIYNKRKSFQILNEYVSRYGLYGTMKKVLGYIKPGNLMHHYRDILGVFHGSYAFQGPTFVQIDLTFDCNNNCIGCWCNSPLLGDRRLPQGMKMKYLPTPLVKEFIDDTYSMGNREIYFSGSGEPFKHGDILEIIEYAKKKGIICYVNTNFTLLDDNAVDRIAALGIDHLTVSTWAGTPQTYSMTHPNKDEKTFLKIKELLIKLNRIKNERPYIKLYNVIFNMNYHEIDKMVDFALETGSESVEFTVIDTIPGATDKLLLNKDQNEQLVKACRAIMQRREKDLKGRLVLFQFDHFFRRITNMENTLKGEYDKGTIDRIPCYIGWTFTRLLPDGNINACLKAHRIPTGNIYEDSFKKIWNGPKQMEFRKKTVKQKDGDPFFSMIGNDPASRKGCYKSCDDISRNINMHKKIMSLSPVERGLLYVLSKFRRKRPPVPGIKKQRKTRFIDDNLDLAGILNGRKAFKGPEHVVIDITNRCNQRCIGCWLYSPLLGKDNKWLKHELPFSRLKGVIEELASMGTKRIRFTGGGEPFLHPDITSLIEYVKKKDMICAVTTGFHSSDIGSIKRLVGTGLDEIAVSLWAGDAKTYVMSHPGTKEDDFKKIKYNLKSLASVGMGRPALTLCNVMYRDNHDQAESMLDFALDVHAKALYFTVIDTIAGGTEGLALTEKQRERLLSDIKKVVKKAGKRIELDNIDGFIKRISHPCIDGEYDRDEIDAIPCYVGWIFSRIMANGDVSPCCRGVHMPMGNIMERSFRSIWTSRKYRDFRCRAKYLNKKDPYFTLIGCYEFCDNLMHNRQVHERISALKEKERTMLERTSA